MLRHTFIALLCSFVAGAAQAQAYKWTDEDGVVHYSDRPHEGAEVVQLPQSAPRPAPPAPVSRQVAAQPPGNETQPAAEFRYESLTIAAPLAEETLWNIESVLNVRLDLRPALRPGHRIRVYFDGEPRMVNGTNFPINEVYRGVHNIQAEVIDETGKLMIRSVTNRFYVQQNAIAGPPGPGPRPRPRPN